MSKPSPRVLTLVAAGMRRPDRSVLKDLEAADQHPRATFFGEALNSDELDERLLARAPGLRRAIYRCLPRTLAQIIEAFIIRNNYDAVISWSERYGLPFALLLKLTRTSVPHIALFGWPAKSEKAILLKHLHSHIDRILMWSTVQRTKVITELGVPPDKISFIKWPVDQKFFRPMERDTDSILAVGSEMRDYPTFLEAMRGLDIPCHIAAGTLIDKKSKWIDAIDSVASFPSNITVGKKSVLELRELYARSRFVVIPLHQTETDNGITCILEAFAMGKPVICSRTIGQIDVIVEGTTGLLVPVGDSNALREAIRFLWNNPAEAKRMGQEARTYIEQHATLEQFVEVVRHEVEQSIQVHRHKGTTRTIRASKTLRPVS